MKTFLSIPAEDMPRALTLGALLDPESGHYFVPAGVEIAQFKPWLRGDDAPGSSAAPAKGVSLTQLLSRVSQVLDQAFPKSEWVKLEIASFKPGAHTYFDAVDRAPDGRELSKARGIIWGGLQSRLDKKFFDATGAHLQNGLKILVLAKAQFTAQHGFTLIISDIDPDYTLGDMQAKLKRIREELAAAGIADKNRLLPAPLDFTNVAVIAPYAAAGLEDFQVEAQRLEAAGLCRFTYFHAVFQGEKAKDALKQAFIDAHGHHVKTSIDALIVIRGGGATTDLQWLNEPVLAKMVCRFHVPVFTGIGHERDTTILDECAHRRFGTPSKVIAYIRETIAARANKAFEDWQTICQGVQSMLLAAQADSQRQYAEIVAGAGRQLDQAEYCIAGEFGEVRHGAASQLGLGQERAHSLHDAVVGRAIACFELAAQAADRHYGAIHERALQATAAAEARAKNDLDTVLLASRRSIDGIDEHLEECWRGITANAAGAVNQSSSLTEEYFHDVRQSASKMLNEAQSRSQDTFKSILALGVEPTLRRGFVMAKAQGKPVSSRAAALEHEEVELTFHDGALTVTTKKGEENV